jgi:hypothetical protein
MEDRNVLNLGKRLCVKNKLIDRCHNNNLMTFLDQLTYDVQPEIVNIPGRVGDDYDFLLRH